MSRIKIASISLLFFLCSNKAPVIRSSHDDGAFLSALIHLEKANKALVAGDESRALKLAQKAWKQAPNNRLVFDQLWKTYLLLGKHKQALQLSRNYMEYLNDLRRDDSLDNDFLFSRYRLCISETITLLNKKSYDKVDFGAIRETLQFLYQLQYCSNLRTMVSFSNTSTIC